MSARVDAEGDGAIIAQGDTIGSATKFTAATNSDNENKQITFVDVSGSTSPLQRDGGLLYNPSTNAFTVQEGSATTVIDNSGNIQMIKKNKKSFIASKIAEVILDKLLINDRNFN